MRALVTGGAGFIGVHLAHALIGNHFDVTIFDSSPVQIGALADCPVRIVTEDLANRRALQEALGPQAIVVKQLAELAHRDRGLGPKPSPL